MIPIIPPARPVHLDPPDGRIAGTIGGDVDRSATGRPARSRGRPDPPARRLDTRPSASVRARPRRPSRPHPTPRVNASKP
jgi:hypothetical protein